MMHPLDMKAWRALLGMPQSLAAEELGIAMRTYQAYENGEEPVPRAIELACAALSLGLRRYPSVVYDREDEPPRPLDLPALAGLGITKQERAAMRRVVTGKRPKVSGASRWFGRLFRLGIVQPVDAPTPEDPQGQEWALTDRGAWAVGLAGETPGEPAQGRHRVKLKAEVATDHQAQKQARRRPGPAAPGPTSR